MARLFGLVGNRAELAGRVFVEERDALRIKAREAGGVTEPFGWGVASYQGGEVLLRRRPLDDRAVLSLADIAGDVRADALVGHVRMATVGALRSENTHPFRYRQWVFAQTGTFPPLLGAGASAFWERVIATVPSFLRSSVKGETDAELFFFVFLSFLHDAGALVDGASDLGRVREAVRLTLSVMDNMSAEAGLSPGAVNLMVANGDAIVAVHRGATMHVRLFRGRDDAELLIGDDLALRRRTAELGRVYFTLIASDFDDAPPAPRWKALPAASLITLPIDGEHRVEPL
jgi:glutamine amidotransferase